MLDSGSTNISIHNGTGNDTSRTITMTISGKGGYMQIEIYIPDRYNPDRNPIAMTITSDYGNDTRTIMRFDDIRGSAPQMGIPSGTGGGVQVKVAVKGWQVTTEKSAIGIEVEQWFWGFNKGSSNLDTLQAFHIRAVEGRFLGVTTGILVEGGVADIDAALTGRESQEDLKLGFSASAMMLQIGLGFINNKLFGAKFYGSVVGGGFNIRDKDGTSLVEATAEAGLGFSFNVSNGKLNVKGAVGGGVGISVNIARLIDNSIEFVEKYISSNDNETNGGTKKRGSGV